MNQRTVSICLWLGAALMAGCAAEESPPASGEPAASADRALPAPPSMPRPPTPEERAGKIRTGLEELTAQALIDRLADVSREGVGFHSTAWAQGFLAIDDDPEFVGGILGSARPEASPVMREIVHRGLAVLPLLIQHLTDARKTAMVMPTGHMMAMWFSDEYDPRHPDPKQHPPDVNTDLEEQHGEPYTLRVGDLCYVAVGQIVNRSLNAGRYQPTLCFVINSPVRTPALAAAVRSDWSGLTPEQHRESLVQDALQKNPWGTPDALKRLCYYYPDEGEKVALRLLARPLYDDRRLWDFIEERLVKSAGPSDWGRLIDKFRAENGAAADVIPYRLHWIYWETDLTEDEEFLAGKSVAEKILNERYPSYDPLTPPFINAADIGEQEDVVKGLICFPSEQVDRAAFSVFSSAVIRYGADEERRIALDDLAMTCMQRLAGKGYDAAFRDYCDKRIREILATPEDSSERYRLDKLRSWRGWLDQDQKKVPGTFFDPDRRGT